MALDDAMLELAIHLSSSDIETSQRLAWVRSGLITALAQRARDMGRPAPAEYLVDRCAPFSPGLWYARRVTYMDELNPNWGQHMFDEREAIVVLRRAGYLRGLGSWWWIVDCNGTKRHMLWRFRPTFNQDWERG